MVESEKLYKLINSTEEHTWEDIAWLELKSKQYPYFQSIRVIIAKHYLKENHVLKSHKIHTASTYAIDRNILRKRLTEKVATKVIPIESIITEEVKTPEKQIEAIEIQIPLAEKINDTTPSSISRPVEA
jgi:phosphoribosylpyrophosphate synthetase